ncbi:hypothetical protein Bbelb_050810 [Branchiostoma belcheri]|nr:hypothetical protein Bbelb_050810 [Branchiostoma belcheri]
MVLSGDKHTRRDWLHSRAAEIVDLVFAEDIRIATESSHCSEIVTHELKKHNLVVNETVESSSDTSKEHYVFNYHNAKLGMSLLLTNIQDATKEGDGERVMALSTPVRFISGPGQSVICPYNDAHIVKSNRLLRHILNCRKNYTGPDLAVCQYSAVHIMRPAEIQQHEATCPYVDFYTRLTYSKFRLAWYSFLNLLDINYDSGFQCPECGPEPKLVICDGIALRTLITNLPHFHKDIHRFQEATGYKGVHISSGRDVERFIKTPDKDVRLGVKVLDHAHDRNQRINKFNRAERDQQEVTLICLPAGGTYKEINKRSNVGLHWRTALATVVSVKRNGITSPPRRWVNTCLPQIKSSQFIISYVNSTHNTKVLTATGFPDTASHHLAETVSKKYSWIIQKKTHRRQSATISIHPSPVLIKAFPHIKWEVARKELATTLKVRRHARRRKERRAAAPPPRFVIRMGNGNVLGRASSVAEGNSSKMTLDLALFNVNLEKATKDTLPSLLQSDIGLSMLSMAGWRKPTGSTSHQVVLVPLSEKSMFTQRFHLKQASEVVSTVLQVLAPKDSYSLWRCLRESKLTDVALGMGESAIEMELPNSLAECYKCASNVPPWIGAGVPPWVKYPANNAMMIPVVVPEERRMQRATVDWSRCPTAGQVPGKQCNDDTDGGAGGEEDVSSQHPYLWIILSHDLKWKPHVDSITAKANSTLGFLKRNIRGANKEVRKRAYTTLVRPKLEYSSAVWDPQVRNDAQSNTLVEKLESVQRRAVRFVCGDYRECRKTASEWTKSGPADVGHHQDTPVCFITAELQQKNSWRRKKRDGLLSDYSASINGHTGTVQALLTAGATVDARDYLNETPLHAAAKKGHPECVRVLLRAGANTVIRNSDNKTAEELAVQEDVQQVLQLFKGKTSGQMRHLNSAVCDRGLTSVPAEVFDNRDVECLDLSNNRLKSIPEEIGQLKKLQRLELYSNLLTQLPQAITTLPNLQVILLSHNKLETLPDGFSRLEQLHGLNIQNNVFKKIPEEVCSLLQLGYLGLGGNPLKCLPDKISQLTGLTRLDINDCQFDEFPRQVLQLKGLKELYMGKWAGEGKPALVPEDIGRRS